MAKILLYAPNVHSGGGKTLLLPILDSLRCENFQAILDIRIKDFLEESNLNSKEILFFSRNSFYSRLKSEFILKANAHKGDTVLCFNSLPPIFPSKAKVYVYFHNKHLIHSSNFSIFNQPILVIFRIIIERLIGKFFSKYANEYIVQTHSMLNTIKQSNLNIRSLSVLPFIPDIHYKDYKGKDKYGHIKDIDFIYIASGDAHKNHELLFRAWVYLSKKKIYPKLVLTLSSEYTYLIELMREIVDKHGLNILNLGRVDNSGVYYLMHNSKALIFPSTTESFGLPLIEASQAGLEILASELDYVRDVCNPVETFNPNSHVSIGRSVERFLGSDVERPCFHTASDVLKYIKSV